MTSEGLAVRLTPIVHRPAPEFEELLRDSVADERRTLVRLVDEWRAGVDRFDRPGELLLAAWLERRLVGCGGRTVDPDLGAPDVGRVRRLYVDRRFRRRGIGQALLEQVLDHAGRHFRMMTVHAPDAAAGGFYERFGFERWPEPPITHVRWSAGRP